MTSTESNTLRLLIATPLYPPDPGGPATHTKLLEEQLPKSNIAVSVCKFGDVRTYPRVLRHAMYTINLLKAAHSADVLLVQDTVSCGIPAALVSLLTRKPLVARVPGDYAWEQGVQRYGITADLDSFQMAQVPMPIKIMRMAQNFTVRRASLVIVPSSYFAGIVSHWGVRKENVIVIHHGIEQVEVTQVDAVPTRPFMVSIGRLVPWKGFALLIRLLPTLTDWHLVIVGDGPDRQSLEKIAREEGVADRVLFTGAVPRTEALGWCKAADVFVLNTSFESFSFQVLEAMMLGTPIVSTRIGSIPELLTDGTDGLLLEPNDSSGFIAAITSVQGNVELWNARRDSARTRAQEFSVEKMIQKTVKTLETLV